MDEFHKRLTALRRDIHRDPEVGFQEERTKAKVAGILRDLDLEVHEGAGVVGILKAGAANHRGAQAGAERARLSEDRLAVERFMRQIVDGVAAAHGADVAMSFNTEFIETINAPGPTEAVVRAARTAGLDAVGDRTPMSFSEDFSHFCVVVPGCFLLLGNGEDGPHGQPLHSADYDFNDALLLIGAAFWAELVRDRLPARQDY